MKVLKMFLMLFVVMVMPVSFVGCGSDESFEQEQHKKAEAYKQHRMEQEIQSIIGDTSVGGSFVKMYGHGLYFFSCTGDQFGYAFHKFCEANTNLEFVSQSGEVQRQNRVQVRYPPSNADYGATVGYWVHFREKSQK